MPEEYKRFPTSEKKISEISPEDVRVGVVGTIIDKSKNKFAVDDGTGSIEVLLDKEKIKKLKAKKTVRVVGKIISEDGTKLSAEAVQDFSDFDSELYKKILNYINKK